jgi:hypothetical protein
MEVTVKQLMKQSISWEANSCSVNQEILKILWNTKVHYRVHTGPPLPDILSQIIPIYSLPSYFITIRFNGVL